MRRHFSTDNLVGMAQAGINRLSRLLYRPPPQQQDDQQQQNSLTRDATSTGEDDNSSSSSSKHVDPTTTEQQQQEANSNNNNNNSTASLPEYLQIARQLEHILSQRRRLNAPGDEELVAKSLSLFCDEVANVISNFNQQKRIKMRHDNKNTTTTPDLSSQNQPQSPRIQEVEHQEEGINKATTTTTGLSPVANSSNSSPSSSGGPPPPPSQQHQQVSSSSANTIPTTLSAAATPHAENFAPPALPPPVSSSSSAAAGGGSLKSLPSFKDAIANSSSSNNPTTNTPSSPTTTILRLSRNSEQHWLEFFNVCLTCFQVLPSTLFLVNNHTNNDSKNNNNNNNLLERFISSLLEIIDFEFVHYHSHHSSSTSSNNSSNVSNTATTTNAAAIANNLTPFSYTLTVSAYILLNDILATRPLLLVPLSSFFSAQLVRRCEHAVKLNEEVGMNKQQQQKQGMNIPKTSTSSAATSKMHSRVPSLSSSGSPTTISSSSNTKNQQPTTPVNSTLGGSKFSKRGSSHFHQQQQQQGSTNAVTSSDQFSYLLPLLRLLVLVHRSILRCEALHSEAANEAKTILFFFNSSATTTATPSNEAEGDTTSPTNDTAATTKAEASTLCQSLLSVFTSCILLSNTNQNNQNNNNSLSLTEPSVAAIVVQLALFTGSLVRSNMHIKEVILTKTSLSASSSSSSPQLQGFDQLFSAAISLLDVVYHHHHHHQASLLFPLTTSLLTATASSTSAQDKSSVVAAVQESNQKNPLLRMDEPHVLVIGELAESIIELCTTSGEFSRCRVALLQGDGSYETSAAMLTSSSASVPLAVQASPSSSSSSPSDTLPASAVVAAASNSAVFEQQYHLLLSSSSSLNRRQKKFTSAANNSSTSTNNNSNNSNTRPPSSSNNNNNSGIPPLRFWVSMPTNWDTLLGSSVLFSWKFASVIAECGMSQQSASVLFSILENVDLSSGTSAAPAATQQTKSSGASSSSSTQIGAQATAVSSSSSSDAILRCLVASLICLCRANPGNAQTLLSAGAFRSLFKILVPEQHTAPQQQQQQRQQQHSGVSDNLWSISATLLNSLVNLADLSREDWLIVLGGISSLRNPTLSNSPQRELCEFVELCLSSIGSVHSSSLTSMISKHPNNLIKKDDKSSSCSSSDYLWFDGRKSYASCMLKNGLPGAWNGYSVSMWLKPSVVWADGTLLFSITEQDTTDNNNNRSTSTAVHSLFSVELVANGAMLQLCIRMSTSKDQMTVIMIPESSFSINTAKIPMSSTMLALQQQQQQHVAAAAMSEKNNSNNDGTSNAVDASADATTSSLAANTTTTTTTTTISNSSGVWHHLALNHNMSGLTVYIDGKKCPNVSSVPYISKKSKNSRFVLNVGGSSFNNTLPSSSSSSSSNNNNNNNNNNHFVVAPSTFGRISQAQFFDGYLHDKDIEKLLLNGPSGNGLSFLSSESSTSSTMMMTFSNATESAKLCAAGGALSASSSSDNNSSLPRWTGSRVDHSIVNSVSAHADPQVSRTLTEVDALEFCVTHLRSGLGTMPNRSSIVILCTDLLATYFLHCPSGREQWGMKDGPAKLGAELLLWNSVPSQVTYALFSLIVTNSATYVNSKNQQITTSTGEKKVLFARHRTCGEVLHLILDIIFGPSSPRAASSILRELANFLNHDANVNFFCQVVGMETFLAYATVCDNSCIEDFVMVVERITKQQREMGELLRFLSWRPVADPQVLNRLDRMKCSFLCMLYDIVKANEEKVPVIQKSLAASILTPGTTTVETPNGVVVEVENVDDLPNKTVVTSSSSSTNQQQNIHDDDTTTATGTIMTNYYPIAELIFAANGLHELVALLRVSDHHETLRICAIRLICMTVYCSPRAKTFFNNSEQFNGVALIEEALLHHAQNGSTFTLNTFQSLVKAALEFYRPNNDAISGSVLSKLRAGGNTLSATSSSLTMKKQQGSNNNSNLEVASSLSTTVGGGHSVSFTGHVPSMMELKIEAGAEQQQPQQGQDQQSGTDNNNNTSAVGSSNNNNNNQQQQQHSVTSAISSDGLESRLKSDDGYNAGRDKLHNPAFIHIILRLLHAVTEHLRQQSSSVAVAGGGENNNHNSNTNFMGRSPTNAVAAVAHQQQQSSSSSASIVTTPTATTNTSATSPPTIYYQKFVAMSLQVYKYIDGILSLTPNVTKMLQFSGFLVLEEVFETAKPFAFGILVNQLEGTVASLMTQISASTPRATSTSSASSSSPASSSLSSSFFTQVLSSNPIATLTRHIIRSVMIVDVIKNSKTTTKNSVVGEFMSNPALQRIVLEETFREMSGRHRIENLDASDANVALKNLEVLLLCVEELGYIVNHGAPLFPSSLGIELIRCIDSIAAESTPAIRSKLMKTKLIDLRNRLALHLLSSSDACPCSAFYSSKQRTSDTSHNNESNNNNNNNDDRNKSSDHDDDETQQQQQQEEENTATNNNDNTEEDAKAREQKMMKVIQCCRGDSNASIILFKHLLDAVKNQNAEQLSDTLTLIRSLFATEIEQRNAIIKVAGGGNSNDSASLDILVKAHRVNSSTGQMITNEFGTWVREKPQEWEQQLGKKIAKAVKPVESEMKSRHEKREKESQARKKQLLQDREKRLNGYNKVSTSALKMLKEISEKTVASMEHTFTRIQEERVERFDRYAVHEVMSEM